jgi:hypothetical protein
MANLEGTHAPAVLADDVRVDSYDAVRVQLAHHGGVHNVPHVPLQRAFASDVVLAAAADGDLAGCDQLSE